MVIVVSVVLAHRAEPLLFMLLILPRRDPDTSSKCFQSNDRLSSDRFNSDFVSISMEKVTIKMLSTSHETITKLITEAKELYEDEVSEEVVTFSPSR